MAGLGHGDRVLCPTSKDVANYEEIQAQEELDEESEQVTVAVDPGQPTERQVEEHRTRVHVPYRSWCRWCSLGRGVCLQHHRKDTPIIPIVAMDDFFLTEVGVKTRKEVDVSDAELKDASSRVTLSSVSSCAA